MKSPGSLLLSVALPVLLVAGAVAPTAAPPPPPPPPPGPASQGPPASNYTAEATQTPMVPEYDPATAPQPAYAEAPDEDGLRECVSPEGVPVFTDRRCSDLGATPHVVLPPMGSGNVMPGLPLRVKTCARNQSMLLDGVRAALESHDANRLADYYHWTGMGSTEAYRLMDRLDTFSARPVVDVQLVRAALPSDADVDLYENRFDPPPELAPPPPPGLDEAMGATDPAVGPPPPPRRRRPLASMLRVDQMRSDKDVASTVTYFHLLTNAGCWWMRF